MLQSYSLGFLLFALNLDSYSYKRCNGEKEFLYRQNNAAHRFYLGVSKERHLQQKLLYEPSDIVCCCERML
ncbi:hypothetical protein BX070DRAFT_223868 [Coemansia spiralis]|nr:hypothetical protein BX070DRAFT_223868 [Coemansia spiralis]